MDCRRVPLAEMVLILLDKHLPKEGTARLSAWGGALTEEQKRYAALDAYASYLVTVKILDTESPDVCVIWLFGKVSSLRLQEFFCQCLGCLHALYVCLNSYCQICQAIW
jgi:hypothetical protein